MEVTSDGAKVNLHQLSVEHCCCLPNKGKTYRFFPFFFPCLLLLSGEETRSKGRGCFQTFPLLWSSRKTREKWSSIAQGSVPPSKVHHISSQSTQPLPENPKSFPKSNLTGPPALLLLWRHILKASEIFGIPSQPKDSLQLCRNEEQGAATSQVFPQSFPFPFPASPPNSQASSENPKQTREYQY